MIDPIDRYRGCLVGLAIGDALGAPIEFSPPGSFTPIHGMISGGAFNLQKGQFTDDTSMALCIAESILATGSFDPFDQLDRYVRWYREGYNSSTGNCFDIGNTTRASIEEYETTRKPYRAWSGIKGSNGAIIRLAPVPLAFATNPINGVRLSGESAKTTHHFTESVDTCRLLGGLIIGLLAGTSKEKVLSPGYEPVEKLWSDYPLAPTVQAISLGSYHHKEPPDIRGGGLSTESLEAALWAFARSSNFQEGALLAVNLGDDADSTGAVYGQLAGAYYGCQAIPRDWLQTLYMTDTILQIAEKLYKFAVK